MDAASGRSVGLFGGSFDPPTNAHRAVCEATLNQLNLDEIWLIPTSQNPLKKDRPATSAELRIALLKAAFEDVKDVRIEAVEIEQDGPSYTIDTLRSLISKHPTTHFTWIMGMDAYTSFPRWKEAEYLASLVRFVVINRPNVPIPDTPPFAGMDVRFIVMPEMDVSSTEVRSRVQQGVPIQGLVPVSVEKLIHESGLYRV